MVHHAVIGAVTHATAKTLLGTLVKDVAQYGDVFALMGVMWGGLVHTHVFPDTHPISSKEVVTATLIARKKITMHGISIWRRMIRRNSSKI
jgi:predicted membrane protein